MEILITVVPNAVFGKMRNVKKLKSSVIGEIEMKNEARKSPLELDEESLGQVAGGIELEATQEEVTVECPTCRSRAVVNLTTGQLNCPNCETWKFTGTGEIKAVENVFKTNKEKGSKWM